jgi:WD40 repeat protein
MAEGQHERAGAPSPRQWGLFTGTAGGRSAGQRGLRWQYQTVVCERLWGACSSFPRGSRFVASSATGRKAGERRSRQRRDQNLAQGRWQAKSPHARECGLFVWAARERRCRWQSQALDSSQEPMVLVHSSVPQRIQSLAILADGRLASGSHDGEIRIWPTNGGEGPVSRSHGTQLASLAVLADGRLVSAGSGGEIKIWPQDGKSSPVVLLHGGWVGSLVLLRDGRLASGGEDGKIKLWPKDGL